MYKTATYTPSNRLGDEFVRTIDDETNCSKQLLHEQQAHEHHSQQSSTESSTPRTKNLGVHINDLYNLQANVFKVEFEICLCCFLNFLGT